MQRASTERTVSETAKNEYQLSLKESVKGNDDGAKELPCKKTWRPLLLGNELDQQVHEYVKYMRNRGSAINTTIVMAVAEGIVKSKDANLQKQWWIWRH